MEPQLITLILNILLGAFILLGFLFGLRGIKKSTYNFIVFLIKTVTVFILTPIFSKIALGITISGKTIEVHIYNAVVDTVGTEMATSGFISSLINSLPIMIGNVATFILLYIALAIIFKIFAVIIYKIMFRKDKQKVVEKCEIVNGAPQMVKNTVKKNKHRFFGGLVGAAHGFLFIVMLLLPVVGLANIFIDVAGISKVKAESPTVQLQYFDELLRENLPKDVVDYAKALDNSILFKVGKTAGIAETGFNLVAKADINGKTVSFGNEIRAFVNAYDSMVSFTRSSSSLITDYSFEAIYNNLLKNPNDFNYNLLYTAVDKLFDSTILQATGNDALKMVADMMVNGAEDAQSLKLMTHIKKAIYTYANENNSLKDDFKALISLFETAAKSGLLKVMNNEEFAFADIKPILLNEANVAQNKAENEVLNKLTKGITDSKLFQKILIELTNYGLEELEVEMEKTFEFKGNEPVTLRKIDSSKNYELKANELSKIFVDIFTLLEEIESININEIKTDPFNLFDSNIEIIVEKVGNVLNDVISISILKNTGVFASICEEMERTEYNNYINFETLKQTNVVSTQFNYLADSVKAIKDSGIINEIRDIKNINDGAERIKSIISKLANKTNGTTTAAQKIVEPLLKCNILKNAVVYGLEKANNYLETELKKVNPKAELNSFNTEDLMTADENANFVSLINNLIEFANGVTLSKILTSEFIDELLRSDDNIVNLGSAMDAIQQSSLFADHDGKEGVYKNIMDALDGYEVFNEFFDFEVAKNSEYRWRITTQGLIDLKTDLYNVVLDVDGEEVELLKYILTFGDYNTLVDGLKGKYVDLTKLFEIDILKPTAVKVINLIKAELRKVIDDGIEDENEKFASFINDIDESADIKAQAESINSVINAFLNLVDEIESDIVNTDATCAALTALSNNASDDGVFKDACNLFMIRIINSVNSQVIKFVGYEDVSKLIEMLTPQDNILDFSDEVIKVAETLWGINFEKFKNLKDIDLDGKDEINVIINSIADASVKENSPFSASYNALLVGIVNAINNSMNVITGVSIEQIKQETFVEETEVAQIRQLLNNVMDVIIKNKIQSIEIETANIAEIFEVVDLFKNNTNIVNGAFETTYNAMLIYITNIVRNAVGNAVDKNLGSLPSDKTPLYDDTMVILTSGQIVFNIMEERGLNFAEMATSEEYLEDYEASVKDLYGAFINALEKNTCTADVKIAIENYIIKQTSL